MCSQTVALYRNTEQVVRVRCGLLTLVLYIIVLLFVGSGDMPLALTTCSHFIVLCMEN